MNFTLRQAQYFCAVARLLHFGKAAEELFVSQPVVSQEVRRLEATFGVALFDRSTRAVRLTAAGESLLPAAEELCRQARDIVELASRFSHERNSVIRLAATPSAMDHLVPLILRQADEELRGLQIEEVPVETGDVGEALETGGCDIGLGRYVTIAPRFRSEVIASDPLMVAIGAQHPLASASSIALGDLADLPLLLWPRDRNPAYYDRLMEVCATGGLDPLVVVGRPRIVGARSYLLAEGRAFALIPESTAAHLAEGIVAVPLATPESLPLSLVWLDRDPRPQVQVFIAMIRRLALAESSVRR